MRPTLERWIIDSDALRQLRLFRVPQAPLRLSRVVLRSDDYYISLVGELFYALRHGYVHRADWAKLGNAFYHFIGPESSREGTHISSEESALFSATAFYAGGFPASAYIVAKEIDRTKLNEAQLACFELLARPGELRSGTMELVVNSLRLGDLEAISVVENVARMAAAQALSVGPDEWIVQTLLHLLLSRFTQTNIRAILPEGQSDFWTPLVQSLLERSPPTWDFFPSQIEALRQGLLTREEPFALQMPTGAGKTTLCETLIYHHLKCRPNSSAVLLVPFRALATELRSSLVKRLNAMGLASRCAYGGTVPAREEVRSLDDVRALIATPESLSGLLSANPGFYKRLSLVICDEGHLLDSGARGVGLELLLSRMRVQQEMALRIVFMSAIVPNIEEINAWLGGADDTVVRSDYQPTGADFSVLRPSGAASPVVALEMHPHQKEPARYSIEAFLGPTDFQRRNVKTGRINTYKYKAIKAQAVAAARKSLHLGMVAVFSANKHGKQGAVGLAGELLQQLEFGLALPEPNAFVRQESVRPSLDYLIQEYGADWIGCRVLSVGAVLHHGDIPQETREVLEALLRREQVRLAFCTSTLAEGVNLPICTLVLYSVIRQLAGGASEPLLARDIKNLVGRAGRPGTATRGLVICANPLQWPQVAPTAKQQAGELVEGALHRLLVGLDAALRNQRIMLTDEALERQPSLHTLIDGIDATLVDLAAEELGEAKLVQLAEQVADKTFAAARATAESKNVLKKVLALRARRVSSAYSNGRGGWIREAGVALRMLFSVESTLLPRLARWDDISEHLEAVALDAILTWAWEQPEMQAAVAAAFRSDEQDVPRSTAFSEFVMIVKAWIDGLPFVDIARVADLSIDDVLSVHAQVVSFVLQTLVDQGVTVLERLLETQGSTVSSYVANLPERLRFGVPSATGCALAANGVRHRRAAVMLGNALQSLNLPADNRPLLSSFASQPLIESAGYWREVLGELVYLNTVNDLAPGVVR
ncbi:DEAD/DEAH box helicase [Myxococcus sp. AM009]|uniref:DEAD/DEAH box helicase n=1 Tax=Myxococcus sp. AM009 TaxID=2745137 RepID=UPI0015958224|nr:DEAD/DEAH box helicase [Myxococcus sp. AM009]NVI98711.1 DEAD/DEAH box helicase [Myxococcus sp. AM009]